jgi:hypothetical protein
MLVVKKLSKTVFLGDKRICVVLTKGFRKRAGDGTRTRDILLGRCII